MKVQKILNEYRMDGSTTLQLRLVGVCMQRNLGNKWVWECKFNRQVRASACTRLCVFAWGERGGGGEDSNAALSAPKLRLFRRCVAERTTIPSLSTRFSAYTATSAYIITVHVHDNVAQQHPQFKKKKSLHSWTRGKTSFPTHTKN